jgi:hypothetical protein
MAARKRGFARKLAATLFTTLLAPFVVGVAVRNYDPAKTPPAPPRPQPSVKREWADVPFPAAVSQDAARDLTAYR